MEVAEKRKDLKSNLWLAAVERKFQNKGDIDIAKSMLKSTAGLQQAESLSLHHIEQAIQCLKNLSRDG